MTLAPVVVRAVAAISRPSGNSPAADSRNESASPPGFFGTGAPNAVMLTTMTSRNAVSARHSWMATWAASSQDRGTGVVDRRRRIPCSR